MRKHEKKWMSAVADLGCMVCKRLGYDTPGVELHHLRAGQGWGKPDNFHVIPLCFRHHRGNDGVHGLGTKGFVRHYGFTEQDLLDDVYTILGKP